MIVCRDEEVIFKGSTIELTMELSAIIHGARESFAEQHDPQTADSLIAWAGRVAFAEDFSENNVKKLAEQFREIVENSADISAGGEA